MSKELINKILEEIGLESINEENEQTREKCNPSQFKNTEEHIDSAKE